MDKECPERKLDFHAPLLSTRRPGRIIVPREKWDMDSSSGFNDRVPFSWEQSPGKPKEILLRHRKNKGNLAFILPLKPPPIRLHPQSQHSKDSSFNQEDDGNDDGCDGDVDENDEDIDFYSGGLDLFSLAESSDNGMATKKNRKVARRIGGGGAASGGGRRRAPPTPSFMMERFLPAAVALAAESLEAPGMVGSGSDAAAAGGDCTPKVVGGGKRVLPSVSSPLALKSCGLENLLPWRARPKKNAVKGPLRFGCSDWKRQLSPRPK